ncbi:MAG: hypothetical protein JXA22_08955 [Candidatus Thermoplasmatota archaeon]|nr:hypothetical protein [Candidatus Thermoplasmatota archaeon]
MNEEMYKVKIKGEDMVIELAGDKKFVKKAFNELRKVLDKDLKKPRKLADRKTAKRRKKPGRKKKPGPKPKKKVKPKKIPRKDRVDMKDLTLEEIFKLKAPKRENQRVLLMGYYLNKVDRNREFRAMDLPPLYGKLKIKTPKNLSYFLRKMSEDGKGLLVHGRKQGRYKITQKGIDFIYNNIPDAK